ncbi:hypothetical protein Vadar_001333 [Vaccinium darrowii]|uniref:Uncharacterized protein n=1 Tax=Vaccinium darrowii TaxID=229202 RepID=A0ACB7WXG5_9ERIC|nr:hypothetical protein Vadar_001333 [Vaccinium darrowii]
MVHSRILVGHRCNDSLRLQRSLGRSPIALFPVAGEIRRYRRQSLQPRTGHALQFYPSSGTTLLLPHGLPLSSLQKSFYLIQGKNHLHSLGIVITIPRMYHSLLLGTPSFPLCTLKGLSWQQDLGPPLGTIRRRSGLDDRQSGQSGAEVVSALTSPRTLVTLTRAPDISWGLYYIEL